MSVRLTPRFERKPVPAVVDEALDAIVEVFVPWHSGQIDLVLVERLILDKRDDPYQHEEQRAEGSNDEDQHGFRVMGRGRHQDLRHRLYFVGDVRSVTAATKEIYLATSGK